MNYGRNLLLVAAAIAAGVAGYLLIVTKPKPPAPRKVITVCSGCGSEWESYGTGEHEPITKCPNCPMSMEEFELLKERVRRGELP